MRIIRIAIVLGILLLAQGTPATACPMCKYALETNSSEPQAYMVSILFMMGMISSIFLGISGMLWWVSHHDRKSLTEAGYQHLLENAGSQPYQSAP